MSYLLQGFLLGLAYAAPIGTQNIFIINTALSYPLRRVWLTAAIVAFFDVSLSVACFFGVGAVISASQILELVILLAGAVVVIYIGIGLLRSRGGTQWDVPVELPWKKVVARAFVVTWFNPQAIIDGSMLLGASKAAVPEAYSTGFIVACACASVVWWFGMSGLVNLVRTRFSEKVLRALNLVCGAFIVLYGLKLLVSGVQLILTMTGA